MRSANPAYPSQTPIATLADTDATISIEGDEAVVDFQPTYPVTVRHTPTGHGYSRTTLHSPQHDPITVRARDALQKMEPFDIFWAVAEAVLNECCRVGDWLVGRDPFTALDIAVDEDQQDTFEFMYESEVAHDHPDYEEFAAYRTDQERQEQRVTSPLRGSDVPPEAPVEYYPWLEPHVRPILYTYTSERSVDCPICGEYGRTSDFPDGIRCKTHGGFVTCHLRAGENWVRADSREYQKRVAPDASWADIEQVKVVREGYLLTVDYTPIRGNRASNEDIHAHGLDTGCATAVGRPQLYTGTVAEDTRSAIRDDIEVGDEVIFAKYEIVAKKFADEVVVADEKPWASGADRQENFATYYQTASSQWRDW